MSDSPEGLEAPVAPEAEAYVPYDRKAARAEAIRSANSAKKAVTQMMEVSLDTEFEGRSLREWSKRLFVGFSPNPTMEELYNALSKCNSNIAFVNSRVSSSNLVYSLVKREYEDTKDKRFIYEKAQAKGKAATNEYVKALVESQLSDIQNQMVVAESIHKFWVQLGYSLLSTRNSIQSIIYGNSSEMRAHLHTSQTEGDEGM